MRLSDFGYKLPKELIAQHPLASREKSRLMVLARKNRKIHHRIFENIIEYLNEKDCLILNDTKVIPARLFGRRKTGGKVEIFLLDRSSTEKNPVCESLVKPSRRLKEGERIVLESGDEAEVLEKGSIGRFIRFSRSIDDILKSIGHMPLPPYIDRLDNESDKRRYQTVYAKREGATASPTAGLHFTEELIEGIKNKGVKVAYVTLHTNYGTFAPIKTEDVESHKMHKEYFEFPESAAKIINETKEAGGKVFAVGTTTTRVLEHCAAKLPTPNSPPGLSARWAGGQLQTTKGYTDLYIYPGYRFKIVDHIITNFHLPKSTLLLLISAFAGEGLIFEAYAEAIERRYRFFSYGDAMLIL